MEANKSSNSNLKYIIGCGALLLCCCITTCAIIGGFVAISVNEVRKAAGQVDDLMEGACRSYVADGVLSQSEYSDYFVTSEITISAAENSLDELFGNLNSVSECTNTSNTFSESDGFDFKIVNGDETLEVNRVKINNKTTDLAFEKLSGSDWKISDIRVR